MGNVTTLVVIHWIADFVLQNDWMALGKSKRWLPLLTHTSIYSACFIGFGWKFVGITFLLHTLTDYFTSRITSKLWFMRDHGEDPASGWRLTQYLSWNRHYFFVMIGLDQLIHVVTLIWTLNFLQ